MSACESCVRRARLLAQCGARLDHRSHDLDRLWDLLSLPDRQLIDAIGGRRRAELHLAYDELDVRQPELGQRPSAERNGPQPPPASVLLDRAVGPAETVCRHSSAYPTKLRDSTLGPHMLTVGGGLPRLAGMLSEPVIAIVGTRRATDYGMETARGLAHDLAATGITIAGGLSEGIALAVHSGALEAKGATFTVTSGGLDHCSPAHCRLLYRRMLKDGCVLSELPLGARSRGWCAVARTRTLALLAHLVIVVEAASNRWELACAHLARQIGVPIAAVPGRVSSPASRGCNELIKEGAALVRDPQDALDLVYGVGVKRAETIDATGEAGDALDPPVVATLEHIRAGQDTLERLTSTDTPREEIVIALAELELRGLVARGDGGRYVPSGVGASG